MHDRLKQHIDDHQQLVERAADDLVEAAVEIGEAVATAFRDGGRLYLFGNGGSAADAQHVAAEFINRYRLERPALPAIALTTDPSVITSIANDYHYRDVFAKQLRALAGPGDVAMGITTSGASANVLEALRTGRQIGVTTVALLGRQGGEAKGLADITYIAPHDDTPRIQELHLLLEHMICEYVEYKLFLAPGQDSG